MKKLFSPLFFLLLMAHASLADVHGSTGSQSSGVIFSILVDAGITPYMGDYIVSAINEAEKNKAIALLINLDTPGGLYEVTRDIVKAILASHVPVIVYVSPSGARAGSAGVFIALSAHILAMAPSTNIGAAHPVDISGEDIKGDMKEKITNDAKAWARSIAEVRGKNADWAEKSVVGSESISSQEALKIGVIDLIAEDESDLLLRIDQKRIKLEGSVTLNTKGAKIVPLPMSISFRVMKFLSNPNLIYILMLLGILGILIEFQSPGLILPGLLGVVFLAIVFGVQVLPINWFGALLIFAAVAFFIAEIFITSFGLLGIGGLALLILGSYLLFSSGSGFFVEPLIIWLLSAGLMALMLVIGYVLLRSRTKGASSNVYSLIGQIAVVKEVIIPPKKGTVMLYGTFWQACSSERIDSGTLVVVKKIDGTTLLVAKKSVEDK